MSRIFRSARAGLVVLTAVTAMGCATTADLDALREEVRQANATAEQAARDAAAARAAAEAAQTAAETANTTASETNEKLDRMFKKTMYK